MKKNCKKHTMIPYTGFLAYGLIFIELIIQIFGGIYYEQTPQFVWDLGNAILFLVPLLFGFRTGLLCLLSVAVSELVWFVVIKTVGPLLHLASFSITFLALGIASKKIRRLAFSERMILRIILFELSLLGEEFLYRVFIMLVLNYPITWKNVSGTFLSPINPLLLLILLAYCILEKSAEERI